MQQWALKVVEHSATMGRWDSFFKSCTFSKRNNLKQPFVLPSSFSIRLKLALSLQAFSRRSLPSSEDGLGQQPGRAGAVAVSAAGQLAVNALNGFHRNQGPKSPKWQV